jgi:2-oxoglutarate dehydrogenase E1 component
VEDWKSEEWDVLKQEHLKFGSRFKDTGVNITKLKEIGDKITTLPDTFVAHPQIKKIYEQRKKAIAEGKGIDWGTAESLAFATLLMEGYSVRLSGQDVERGTFSHRHAVVFHQDKDVHYTPLTNVVPDGDARKFQVHNSHLSEYGVLGFEYGYAQTLPNTLTIWEAQFGDFANGAQITIDTCVAAGEVKWNVRQGLVMLLPHGYDG